ncbi:TIM barrel protein, partial [Leucobacter komagatae]|uniref:TIM barrel protein n=1 Tax=Leucobacter komagatae TaxID=55969 RepID=UPI0012ECFFD9
MVRAWGYDTLAVFQPKDEWTPAVHGELLELESRTGVRPVEFVLTDDIYGNAMSEDLRLRDACRDMYREAVDVCAELGMVTEIEYEYGPQDPMPLFTPYRQMPAAEETDFVSFYLELLARASGSAAAVLLEPLNRYESRYLNSVSDNLRVLELVNHPNSGLLPDTFHMSIEEQSISGALRSAG